MEYGGDPFQLVPAPPFGEAPRGQVLRQAFVDAGLRNVRVDAVGNVIGDRPGRSSRPRLVVAAHLDTVFPEGTKTNVMRNGATLTGPGIGDNCRGLAVLVAIVRSLDAAAVQTTNVAGGLQSVQITRAASVTGDTRWAVMKTVTPSATQNVVRIDLDMLVNQATFSGTPPTNTDFGPAFGVEAYDD